MIKGIFDLSGGDREPNPNAVNLPFVSGASIRGSWEVMESNSLDYNFSLIVYSLKISSKPVMLRVLPGTHTPAWAMPLVKKMSFTDPTGTRTIPIPWDDTYIQLWCRFIKKLGSLFASNQKIVLVHMAGPTLDSAEFHLPKGRENQAAMQSAGYTKDKIVRAWQRCIDAYAAAFPRQMLALNVSIPYIDDGAMEAIVASGISKLGSRLCVQENALNDHGGNTPSYNMVKKCSIKGVNTGFQMLGVQNRVGNMEIALNLGLAAGAKYFEIYEADLPKAELTSLFTGVSKV